MNKDIFTKNILSTTIQLGPSEYNSAIDETILSKLKDKVEGKCDSCGYINPGSCEIIKRSIGELQQGQFNGSCVFRVLYSVDICNPVEGQIVKCIVKNINKMGLFCELAGFDDSPLTLILAKQHHLKSERFEKMKINNIIDVEIIGIKFDYNDTQISCIGRLSESIPMNKSLSEENAFSEEEMDLGESEEDDNTEQNEEEYEDEEDGEDNQDLPMDNLVKPDSESNDIGGIDMMMKNIEGVQDLESVDLEAQGLSKTDTINDVINSDLDELGEEFEGEQLDLNAIAAEKYKPVYNDPKFEKPGTLGKEVFDLDVLETSKYKTFSKPRKSKKYNNYFVYVQLNNMMIKYFLENGVAPKSIYIGKDNQLKDYIKQFLEKMGKSMKVEETDGISYVSN